MPSFRDTNPFMNYGRIDEIYYVEWSDQYCGRTYKTKEGAYKAAGETGIVYLVKMDYERLMNIVPTGGNNV